MGCIAQIRFRLFTGNYSQYTFQCITPNAADAALALKRTLTNLRVATVPAAYGLFLADRAAVGKKAAAAAASSSLGLLQRRQFIMWMSLIQCVAYMSHYSTDDITQIGTSALIIAAATRSHRGRAACYDSSLYISWMLRREGRPDLSFPCWALGRPGVPL